MNYGDISCFSQLKCCQDEPDIVFGSNSDSVSDQFLDMSFRLNFRSCVEVVVLLMMDVRQEINNFLEKKRKTKIVERKIRCIRIISCTST